MSQAMTNGEIAKKFERLALLLEISGADQYRVRSYRTASQTIEEWPTPLAEIARNEGAKGLQNIPGIGKAISGKIEELLARGTFSTWEQTTNETPESVLDLLKVDGIGLKTAAILHQRFKISSLPDFAAFVAGGGLDLVDGVGEKTAERIAESLKNLNS
jgi:DNA polymerase (family 10)